MEISGIKQGTGNYTNTQSLADVQMARLENYSEELDSIMGSLEENAEIIQPSILTYNKSSVSKTMALILYRNSSQKAQNRKTHQEMVEGLVRIAAKELGMHVDVAAIIARNHDVGHMFLGHDGERWISEVKKKMGLGIYTHNSIGPKELIYRYKVYDDIIEEIKMFHPEKTEAELNRIKRSLWLIFDGINCHNGEMTETSMTPDKTKTEKQFEEEIMKCHTIEGFDRKIKPATIEGCLVRMCDIIAYTPYDMADSLYEGLLPTIEGKHEQILLKFGISPEEIAGANARKNYDRIARKVQIILLKSLIENSSKSTIKLDERTANLMYEFRKANQDIIFAEKAKREETGIYPKTIERIMNYYANMIEQEIGLKNLRNLSCNRYYSKMLMEKFGKGIDEEFIRFITGTTSEIYHFNEQMIKEVSSTTENGKDISLEHKMALEFAAEYLSTLNDHQFLRVAKKKKILTDAEYASIRAEYRSPGEHAKDSDLNEAMEDYDK